MGTDDRHDGDLRDGAWVAEVTNLVDLSGWPDGSRPILRKERPHHGALMLFSTLDGCRLTAFLTDTPASSVPGQLAGLELRHRQQARVEGRIRQAKATRLRNLPLPRLRHQCCLARSRLRRDRPDLLDQAHRLR